MRIRCGVLQLSLLGVDDDEVYATVGLVMGVCIDAGVGNCKLLQTVGVPKMGAGVDVAYPELVGPWLDEETVGLINGLGCEIVLCEIVLLASMVGVFVICQELEPSGMRAYD